MTGHIDQLTEWWENAEKASAVNIGDLVIEDRRGLEGGFGIWPARRNALPVDGVPRRVLSRAPKPKPAWHDAPAIIATWYDSAEDEIITGFWTPDGGVWQHEDGIRLHPDALRDVIPLIEAKVTDDMVESARMEANSLTGSYWERSTISRILTAALGLETE